MKNAICIILLILTLTACKKDSPVAANNSKDLFAANDSLISPRAHIYFIADVEGIPGVTHVNIQDTIYVVIQIWTSGSCPSGACRYGGGVSDIAFSSGNLQFIAEYDGMGESMAQLIAPGFTTFITPAGEKHGIVLNYNAPDGKSYYSDLSDNKALSWANVSLVSREATGDTSHFMNTPYYVKLHFNAELTCYTDTTQKIRLKNGVARVKI